MQSICLVWFGGRWSDLIATDNWIRHEKMFGKKRPKAPKKAEQIVPFALHFRSQKEVEKFVQICPNLAWERSNYSLHPANTHNAICIADCQWPMKISSVSTADHHNFVWTMQRKTDFMCVCTSSTFSSVQWPLKFSTSEQRDCHIHAYVQMIIFIEPICFHLNDLDSFCNHKSHHYVSCIFFWFNLLERKNLSNKLRLAMFFFLLAV